MGLKMIEVENEPTKWDWRWLKNIGQFDGDLSFTEFNSELISISQLHGNWSKNISPGNIKLDWVINQLTTGGALPRES